MSDGAESGPTVDWEAVYREQMPRIYNFFRYRTGDNQTAQDLTATTFLKAWRAREQYQGDLGAFEAWLFGIARNAAADFLRNERLEISLESVYDLPAPESVEREIGQREDFARLYTLLAALPAREAELVALKYGAELTNRAIARVTGLSETNVGTLLHRIVQKLRAEWEPVL